MVTGAGTTSTTISYTRKRKPVSCAEAMTFIRHAESVKPARLKKWTEAGNEPNGN